MAFIPRGAAAHRDDNWYAQLEKEDRDTENRRRASRRAQVDLGRTILTNQLPDLMTFTNGAAEGWPSGRESLRSVNKWLRQGGMAYFAPSGLVAAPEPGEIGERWHVHAAINRRGIWLPYSEIIEDWSAFMESEGYHSPTGTHRWHVGDEYGEYRDGFADASACAGYITHYMSKTLDHPSWLKGQKRWLAVDCQKPTPEVVTGLRMADVPELLHNTFGCSLNGSTRTAYMKPFQTPDGSHGGYWFGVPSQD